MVKKSIGAIKQINKKGCLDMLLTIIIIFSRSWVAISKTENAAKTSRKIYFFSHKSATLSSIDNLLSYLHVHLQAHFSP